MSRMPPLKTKEEVQESKPIPDHKEEDIFVQKKEVDLDQINERQEDEKPNLTIEPVVKKTRKKYTKTDKYMSKKKQDQLARARKKSSAVRRQRTINKAKEYMEEDKRNTDMMSKIEYQTPSVEGDVSRFNIDYDRISDMMIDKFERRMRDREEQQRRAKAELEEQERHKREAEKQKLEWEQKIREDERRKIKGRFGAYTQQYNNRAKDTGLNSLMKPRGNGGTYGNFW